MKQHEAMLDMNIPRKYAGLLSEKGFNVLQRASIGGPKAADYQIMAYVRENDFIVVTYDLDFGAILSSTHEMKPSVVQIRAVLPEAAHVVIIIASAITKYQEDLRNGAVLTIDSKKGRVSSSKSGISRYQAAFWT